MNGVVNRFIYIRKSKKSIIIVENNESKSIVRGYRNLNVILKKLTETEMYPMIYLSY